MPRHRRVTPAGYTQHVLNRRNERGTIFHKPADYEAFLTILADGLERAPVKIFAYCLMKTHFHLVIRPESDDAIPEYMRWVLNVHVRRYRRHSNSVGHGHVYQDRYKNFLIEDEIHLLTVIRYVEGNALRANLVDRAEEWPWSSLAPQTTRDGRRILSPWPFARPPDWAETVNAPFSIEELQQIREAARRGTPFGSPDWTERTVEKYGLDHTLRSPQRPFKDSDSPRASLPHSSPLFE